MVHLINGNLNLAFNGPTSVNDANDAPLGISYIDTGKTNNPSNWWAALLTISLTTNYKNQLCLGCGVGDCNLYYRICDNGSWGTWYPVAYKTLDDGANNTLLGWNISSTVERTAAPVHFNRNTGELYVYVDGNKRAFANL